MRDDVLAWSAVSVSALAAAFPIPVRPERSAAKSKDRDNSRQRDVSFDYPSFALETSARARMPFAAANCARCTQGEWKPTQDCEERNA
jgi:hypothetical protein